MEKKKIDLKVTLKIIFRDSNDIKISQKTKELKKIIEENNIYFDETFNETKISNFVKDTLIEYINENKNEYKFEKISPDRFIKYSHEYNEQDFDDFPKIKLNDYQLSNLGLIQDILQKIEKDINLLIPFKNNLILKEAIESSTIEGNTIQNINEFDLRDDDDIEKKDIEKLKELYLFPIEENFNSYYLKSIHSFVFANNNKNYASNKETIGKFKERDNYINSGFKPCSALKVNDEINKFIEKYKQKPLDFGEAFLKATFLHLFFESIHPFDDGNGRIGRFLFSNYFYFHNYFNNRLLFISTSVDKQKYLDYLNEKNTLKLIDLFINKNVNILFDFYTKNNNDDIHEINGLLEIIIKKYIDDKNDDLIKNVWYLYKIISHKQYYWFMKTIDERIEWEDKKILLKFLANSLKLKFNYDLKIVKQDLKDTFVVGKNYSEYL